MDTEIKSANSTDKMQSNQTEGKLHKMAHATGDAIEKVGQKIQDKGFEKVGEFIHKAGDRIEHSAD